MSTPRIDPCQTAQLCDRYSSFAEFQGLLASPCLEGDDAGGQGLGVRLVGFFRDIIGHPVRKFGASMGFDVEAARAAIITGLPVRARWMLGQTPVDFDFSVGRRGLRHLTAEDVAGSLDGSLDESWADLLIFGQYDVAEGGGARP